MRGFRRDVAGGDACVRDAHDARPRAVLGHDDLHGRLAPPSAHAHFVHASEIAHHEDDPLVDLGVRVVHLDGGRGRLDVNLHAALDRRRGSRRGGHRGRFEGHGERRGRLVRGLRGTVA